MFRSIYIYMNRPGIKKKKKKKKKNTQKKNIISN